MFEVYKFPFDYLPFWHFGARMCVGPFRRFLGRMKKEGRKTILDIGSGGGWNSLLAGLLGFNVTCIDLSERSLENTREMAKRLNIKQSVNTIVGNCYALPFADGLYDIVVASHIIEHLEHPCAMLADISRVLKDNGVLLLSCPSPHQWTRISRWLPVNLDPPDHKVLGYRKRELQSLLPDDLLLRRASYQGRFFESNMMDLQRVLTGVVRSAMKTDLRANPAGSDDPKMTNKGARSIIRAGWVVKESVLLMMILLGKCNDILFFYMKGSNITLEIEKRSCKELY